MLLWLASYPRSGNTFLRIILNSVFGLPSVDIHGARSEQILMRNETVFGAMGGVIHQRDPAELIAESRQCGHLSAVKTHERPGGNDPAIYLVRDGRASIMSYYNYIQNLEKNACTLDDVICGRAYGGSWSEHIYDWAPERRERTLLVRFENLVTHPCSEIERISQFLCLQPNTQAPMSFKALHQLFPEFFRSGSNERNVQELEESGCLELFWRWHTPMMARMGYADG